jgi:putative effector of murein hydrolase
MKEAAGEANLTVVAIILIGVVVAVVTPLINNLMTNTANKACCTDAGGVWSNGNCRAATGSNDYDAAGYRACVQKTGRH